MQHFKNNNLSLLRVYKTSGGVCLCPLGTCCKAPGKHPASWNRQRKNLGVNNAKRVWQESEFEGFNVGVKCGQGLLVVDIDPRHGGHITWADICGDNPLPETWTVSTGGGGTHYYFRVPSGTLCKSLSYEGIDFQYDGRYVIAPPSTHVSGQNYDFVDCDPEETEIAALPDFLAVWLSAHAKAHVSAMIPQTNTGTIEPSPIEWPFIHTILDKLKPNIGYHNWLGVGMGLHNTGHPNAFNLWDSWSRKDNEQYVEGECAKKWASFSSAKSERHSYRWIFAMADLYKIPYGPDNSFLANWKSTPLPKEIETLAEPEGKPLDHGYLMTELVNMANTSSHIIIPNFAISCALQIMSASVQGTYKSWSNAPLSLYQWCAAPAGFGKDAYLNFTKDFLRDIHKSLLPPAFGSVGGLRSCLLAFNSLCSVKDEWHDEFIATQNANNEYAKALGQDYKILYNAPKILDGVAIKASIQPPISYPSFGLQGFSTLEGLGRCAKDGQFLVSGLGSRFLFWLCTDYGKMNDPIEPDKHKRNEIMRHLRHFFNLGVTLTGKNTGDALVEISKVQESFDKKKKPIGHLPQTMASKRIEIDSEAKEWFEELKKTKHQETVETLATGRETFASVISRHAQTVIRIACLRALSDLRYSVAVSDLEYADALVSSISAGNLEFFQLAYGGTSRDDDDIRRIEKVYAVICRKFKDRGGPMPKKDFMPFVHLQKSTLDPILLHLADEGKIEVFDRNKIRVYPKSIEANYLFSPSNCLTKD